MRRSSSVLFLAASALLLLMSAAPAHAAFPGQNGKIAFLAISGNDWNVYTVDSWGAPLVPLAADPNLDESDPAWSPDGRSIAFTRCGAQNYCHIAVTAADGSGLRTLTPTVPPWDASDPAWSPDGTRLAFRQAAPPGDIWVMNADGSDPHPVSALQPSPGACFSFDVSPDWSPDGELIAFSRTEYRTDCDTSEPGHGPAIIATVDPAGTQLTRLANGSAPDWSPDGQQIAVDGVRVMNADGTGMTTVTPGSAPAWSPDGRQLAFHRLWVVEQGYDVGTHDIASGMEVNLTASDPDGDYLPDWQPLPYSPTPETTHDHPNLASPVRVALVPNFRQTISSSQCPARGGTNSTHGPPLAFTSCNPPGFVPGTIAHMGPGSSSFASYATIYGDTDAANGDQANVTLRALLNDIRTSGGADYPADLTLVTKLRITDRFNGGSQSDSATVADFDYQSAIDCVSTAGPEGATCALDTSADAVTPDTIKENKGTVIQVFRYRVNDSGANGTRGDGDDRTFATQGIYIP